MDVNVVRTVAFFDKRTEELVGEYPLVGIDLPTLQALFRVEPEDPMYDVWAVGPAEAALLRNHVIGNIDLERYDYFVECSAIQNEGVPETNVNQTEVIPGGA